MTTKLPWMFLTLAIYLPHVLSAPADLVINPQDLSPPPPPEDFPTSSQKPEPSPLPADVPVETVSSSPVTDLTPTAPPPCQVINGYLA